MVVPSLLGASVARRDAHQRCIDSCARTNPSNFLERSSKCLPVWIVRPGVSYLVLALLFYAGCLCHPFGVDLPHKFAVVFSSNLRNRVLSTGLEVT